MSGPFVVAFVLGVTPGKWAGIWRERMPRHPLEMVLHSPAEAVAALLDGTVDVALLRLPVADESLSRIPLYIEQPVVVAPKDHAVTVFDSLTLDDLAGETILDDEWSAAVELVAANVGLAIMPQSVARALSRRDVVARPLRDGTETQVALAWPTERTTPEVDEFIGIVRGRTANSSRGEPTPPTPPEPRKKKAPRTPQPRTPQPRKKRR